MFLICFSFWPTSIKKRPWIYHCHLLWLHSKTSARESTGWSRQPSLGRVNAKQKHLWPNVVLGIIIQKGQNLWNNHSIVSVMHLLFWLVKSFFLDCPFGLNIRSRFPWWVDEWVLNHPFKSLVCQVFQGLFDPDSLVRQKRGDAERCWLNLASRRYPSACVAPCLLQHLLFLKMGDPNHCQCLRCFISQTMVFGT
jgi:hypothetical protein